MIQHQLTYRTEPEIKLTNQDLNDLLHNVEVSVEFDLTWTVNDEIIFVVAI